MLRVEEIEAIRRAYAADGKEHGCAGPTTGGGTCASAGRGSTGFPCIAANEPDVPVAARAVLPGVQGWARGEHGDGKAGTSRDQAARGLSLRAPDKDKKRERSGWSH